MLLSRYISSMVHPELARIEYIAWGEKEIIQALRVPMNSKLRNRLLKWVNNDAKKVKQWFINWINNDAEIDQNKKKDCVKKSVRIDEAMYNKLRKIRNCRILSYVVNKIVMEEIASSKIDLIGSRGFDYKITIYFTKKEYSIVEQVMKELKSRKLGVTFSSIVRSILYKRMNLVLPVEGGLKNVG